MFPWPGVESKVLVSEFGALALRHSRNSVVVDEPKEALGDHDILVLNVAVSDALPFKVFRQLGEATPEARKRSCVVAVPVEVDAEGFTLDPIHFYNREGFA